MENGRQAPLFFLVVILRLYLLLLLLLLLLSRLFTRIRSEQHGAVRVIIREALPDLRHQ